MASLTISLRTPFLEQSSAGWLTMPALRMSSYAAASPQARAAPASQGSLPRMVSRHRRWSRTWRRRNPATITKSPAQCPCSTVNPLARKTPVRRRTVVWWGGASRRRWHPRRLGNGGSRLGGADTLIHLRACLCRSNHFLNVASTYAPKSLMIVTLECWRPNWAFHIETTP